MTDFNEDYTAGVLAGVPIFCINRIYESNCQLLLSNWAPLASHVKAKYRFNFDNGFGASIVEFVNREITGGHQYELAVMGATGSLVFDTGIAADVERGNEYCMHELLCKIEALIPAM